MRHRKMRDKGTPSGSGGGVAPVRHFLINNLLIIIAKAFEWKARASLLAWRRNAWARARRRRRLSPAINNAATRRAEWINTLTGPRRRNKSIPGECPEKTHRADQLVGLVGATAAAAASH